MFRIYRLFFVFFVAWFNSKDKLFYWGKFVVDLKHSFVVIFASVDLDLIPFMHATAMRPVKDTHFKKIHLTLSVKSISMLRYSLYTSSCNNFIQNMS